MKGFYFFEMQDEKPIAQGRVGAQLNQDHIFVQYDGPRSFGRVITISQLTRFALFKTTEEMTAFLNPPLPYAAPPAPLAEPGVPVGTSNEKPVDTDKAPGAE